MNKHFIYCFFKYVHSVRLQEVLNVGLFMAFPEERLLVFKHPENFHRIKCLYYDFEEELLKRYLDGFNSKVRKLNIEPWVTGNQFNEIDLAALIKREFISEDEGSLQISNIRKAVKYTTDIEQIANELYFSYFQHYYYPEELLGKKIAKESLMHDENYILSTLYDLITKETPRLRSLNFNGREIKTNNVSLKFGFEWNNRGLHLVKPFSLDYRSSSTIEEKAHSLHSKLHILEMEWDLNSGNYQFDILVSKPQISKLQPVYKKAISIIGESSNKVNIIEEDGYSTYSKEAAKALAS